MKALEFAVSVQYLPHAQHSVNACGAGASAVVFSRDRSLKMFDFSSERLTSTVSVATRDRLMLARESPLFSYFATPDFEFEIYNGTHVKSEKLYNAPCIGMTENAAQENAFGFIVETYTKYVNGESEPPDPDAYMAAYYGLCHKLDGVARDECVSLEPDVRSFLSQVRTVPAHLDFNIGNFITTSPLMLIDIEDVGLQLPASYDILNLLLNEIYEGRSLHLLRKTLDNPSLMSVDAFLHACTDASYCKSLRVPIFVNFMLRESDEVALALVKRRRSSCDARNAWRRFQESIPGWPLSDSP